ncbi:MAG: methylmalonyl-CoA epimerase [bacterium]|nr:methylmalonyl-CoA epimerase [bacterium]
MIRKIEHIGVAVSDIREAEKMYTETLSLRASSRETHGELLVAFFPVGDTTLELLQSTTPDGIISKYIREKGEGVHHIAFRVDDIGKALEDLRSKGVELVDREPRAGARNAKIAFLDPKSTNGLLIELVEPGEE